ncbi:hypothetical protein N431DRAFT_489964 [Stipitochalara longipes BDJ]|nr:hypothetical protein N431DRAFT_489964 [Stipitochalara longipes BDJ]
MQRHRVRPDPVSCQTCRSKKLKCNRVQPCSNCIARGITCTFLVPPQGQTDTSSAFQGNAELLARIKRLEDIVLKQSSPTETSKYGSDDCYVSNQRPRPEGVIVSDVHQEQDQDSRLLEIKEDLFLSSLSNGLAFNISNMHEILERKHPTLFSNNYGPNNTIIIIPVYKVATLLFQSYESNVDHLCHILHLPTIRSLIKTFYLSINQNESVLPGQAALLVSIFAIGAYFYQPADGSEVATTSQDANHLYKILSRGALDILDYSRRNTSGTLEDVQASILMSFVAYHLDGFSAGGRGLLTTAAAIAKGLRFHRLDADNESSDETSARLLIDREVKRRVFWHIATTDWLLSNVSGPYEGTYFINPNHVNVKPPKDCNDDDLVSGIEDEPGHTHHPTDMTFFLARLQLAHLCREITDTVPISTTLLLQLPYIQILSLDTKLQSFLSTLPFFLKLDASSRAASKSLETVYPKLAVLRYCINTEAWSTRCKLHQRFLHRQSIDPQYAYSRRACLDSARAAVAAYADLRAQETQALTERMGMAVHFTHMALVVMVMDLCFNREEPDGAEIKIELKKALQLFAKARNASPLLIKFLASLEEVLRKHGIQLGDASTSSLVNDENDTAGLENGIVSDAFNGSTGGEQLQFLHTQLESQDSDMAFNAPFDEFWMLAMQGESTADSIAWDNLFSALDSRLL